MEGEEESQEPQLVLADKEVVKRRKNMEGDEKEVVKRSKYMQGEEEGSEQPQGKKYLDDKHSDLVRTLEALIAESKQASIRHQSWIADCIEESWKKAGVNGQDQLYLALGRPISTLPLNIQKSFWLTF